MTKEEFIQEYVLKYRYSDYFKTTDVCIESAANIWQKIHDKVKEEAPIKKRIILMNNNGGPAFPKTANDPRYLINNEYHSKDQEGMTLRDYFAAKALEGDFAAQNEFVGEFMTDESDSFLLERCQFYYRVADAMLKARE